jgi:formylglycine-generating enzyme required for sulfatase activity
MFQRVCTVAWVVLAVLGGLTLATCQESKPVGGQTISPAKEVTTDLGGGVKLEMVLIPAGEFLMGSPASDRNAAADEKPQHRVRITKPFYLGKYPVTQEQWTAVMGSNPSLFKGPKNPVEEVSWDDCVQFFKRLNEKVGGGKYRFPTEAQWEYACRAGTSTRFCFGDDEAGLAEYGWYDKNSGGTSHPVGEKKPNAWGLYDMHGNVSEWCQDWYGEYGPDSQTDPCGPKSASGKVVRGGSWLSNAKNCRSASRFSWLPDSRIEFIGFRIVKEISPGDRL